MSLLLLHPVQTVLSPQNGTMLHTPCLPKWFQRGYSWNNPQGTGYPCFRYTPVKSVPVHHVTATAVSLQRTQTSISAQLLWQNKHMYELFFSMGTAAAVRVTLHTPASYYLLIYNLMWNVGDQSESEVKCKPLKTAGQLEKYLSPMSLNGHVKRWPSAREGWWPNNSAALTFAFANAC